MGNFFKSFFVSLNFLTIFSFEKASFSELKEVGQASWTFPLAGAFVGIILVVTSLAVNFFLPHNVSAMITVGLWIFVTGGLHLDGWTDCWDAFGAAVTRERRLEIIKDSRLGSFGAMSLFILLGLKVSCISTGLVSSFELLLACVVGRSLMVCGFSNCACMKPGMAASFTSGIDTRTYGIVWLLTLPFAVITGIDGIIALAAAYWGLFFFRRFAENKLGFINGDVLGATCELSETLVLITVCWR